MAKSVIHFDDCCYVCGSTYNLHTHHCLYGTSNRKLSDKYGYVVRLCQEHHTGNNGVHFNKELDLHFKQLAQKHYEENHGSREDFIRTFGRSYL